MSSVYISEPSGEIAKSKIVILVDSFLGAALIGEMMKDNRMEKNTMTIYLFAFNILTPPAYIAQYQHYIKF